MKLRMTITSKYPVTPLPPERKQLMRFSNIRPTHSAMFVLALCALTSFSVAVARVAADDKSHVGLVITKAVYGDLPNGKFVDVTQKVKDAVADGALFIDASNVNFGDPAPNAPKKRKVDYNNQKLFLTSTPSDVMMAR